MGVVGDFGEDGDFCGEDAMVVTMFLSGTVNPKLSE